MSLREKAAAEYEENRAGVERCEREIHAEYIDMAVKAFETLTGEKLEPGMVTYSEVYNEPLIEIEGLRFIANCVLCDPGDRVPIRMLGQCPECGEETMSEVIISLISLGRLITKFEPAMFHECGPTIPTVSAKCPLDRGYNCVEKSCPWWVESKSQCAIKVLGEMASSEILCEQTIKEF